MTPAKYNQLNELLADYSRLSAELGAIESKVNHASLAAARPMLPDYAEKKARLGDIEDRLKVMAQENPELFPDDKKTYQTPFGAVSFRKSSRIEIEDEAIALQRIKLACMAEERRSAKAQEPPRYTVATLIRTSETPNLEALELLEDVELKTVFGIERIHEEKFSVKPLEVKTDRLSKKTDKELKQAA